MIYDRLLFCRKYSVIERLSGCSVQQNIFIRIAAYFVSEIIYCIADHILAVVYIYFDQMRIDEHVQMAAAFEFRSL